MLYTISVTLGEGSQYWRTHHPLGTVPHTFMNGISLVLIEIKIGIIPVFH